MERGGSTFGIPELELPPLRKCQIHSFMRIEWTEGYMGQKQFREEVWPEGEAQNTVHFVLEERGFVISHAGVVWKRIEHDGETYETGGLTGVLTFPDFRRRGYGTQVIEAATRYIVDKGADIGLTTSHLRSFYTRLGWVPMEMTNILHGDPANPTVVDELVLMLFLSEKGKRGRVTFEGRRIHVGAKSW
jgi:GNAT superfamily N-acetyltransferase